MGVECVDQGVGDVSRKVNALLPIAGSGFEKSLRIGVSHGHLVIESVGKVISARAHSIAYIASNPKP